MNFLLPLTGLLLSGCITLPAVERASGARTFRTDVFFAGGPQGRGALKVILSGSKSIAVHDSGQIEPDGTLILNQRVEEQGKPAKRRQWRVPESLPGRYAGTLTDAAGPVAGEVTRSRLHLSFPMDGGLRVDQWLDLASDGRYARNHMVVRKLGIVVAKLEERIAKV
jgi:hypothetical protein